MAKMMWLKNFQKVEFLNSKIFLELVRLSRNGKRKRRKGRQEGKKCREYKLLFFVVPGSGLSVGPWSDGLNYAQVADAVMDEVSDTIHDQKKILKEEMVQVIDKKLDDKIKVQLQEINDLQATINKLKQGNNQVCNIFSTNVYGFLVC